MSASDSDREDNLDLSKASPPRPDQKLRSTVSVRMRYSLSQYAYQKARRRFDVDFSSGQRAWIYPCRLISNDNC